MRLQQQNNTDDKKQEQGKLPAIHENAPIFLFFKDLKIVILIFHVTLSPLISDIWAVIIRTIHTYWLRERIKTIHESP